MPKLPVVSGIEVVKALAKIGYEVDHQSGSHMILHSNADHTKRITLPIHNKDLKPGTLSSILKQAGVDKKELFK